MSSPGSTQVILSVRPIFLAAKRCQIRVHTRLSAVKGFYIKVGDVESNKFLLNRQSEALLVQPLGGLWDAGAGN